MNAKEKEAQDLALLETLEVLEVVNIKAEYGSYQAHKLRPSQHPRNPEQWVVGVVYLISDKLKPYYFIKYDP